METTKHIELSNDALEVITTLEEAGFSAWIVGGWVRDTLMGVAPHDMDIATSARWEQVKELFNAKGNKVYETGTTHGTVTVSAGNSLIEVTTYRSDGAYTDARHPDAVVFLDSIEKDLARRDFTMNAIAYNPAHGILDPFLGVKDIEDGVIRTVGDAHERLSEDPLRIMRAVRFASQLGFKIEETSAKAAHELSSKLALVAYERLETEFARMLMGAHVCEIILEWIDVISVFIPEAQIMKDFDQKTKYHVYDVLGHTAHVVAEAPQRRRVRYAAFFHDIAKPRVFTIDENGIGHAYGHAPMGAEMTRKALTRLRLSRNDVEHIVSLVAMHQDIIPTTQPAVKRALYKLNGDVELFRDLLDLKRADAKGHAPDHQDRAHQADEVEEVLEEVLKAEAAFCLQDLHIDGNDVMMCGIPSGPAVGAALELVMDAVIDGIVPNEREVLLEFIANKTRNMRR